MSKRKDRQLTRRSLRRALKAAINRSGLISTTKLLKLKYGAGAKASNMKEKDC